MTDFWPALTSAFELITQDDGYLREIIALSLRVSLTAVVIVAYLSRCRSREDSLGSREKVLIVK